MEPLKREENSYGGAGCKETEVHSAGAGPFIKLRPFRFNANGISQADRLNAGIAARNRQQNKTAQLENEKSLMSIFGAKEDAVD